MEMTRNMSIERETFLKKRMALLETEINDLQDIIEKKWNMRRIIRQQLYDDKQLELYKNDDYGVK